MAGPRIFDRGERGAVGRLLRRLRGAFGAAPRVPPGFDAGSYLACNGDVAAAVGADRVAAARHFARFGMAEGRRVVPPGQGIRHPESRALPDLGARVRWRKWFRDRAAGAGGEATLLWSLPRAGWLLAGPDLAAYLTERPDVARQCRSPAEAAFHLIEIGIEQGSFGYPERWSAETLGPGAARPGETARALARRLAPVRPGAAPPLVPLTPDALWARPGLDAEAARWRYAAQGGRLDDIAGIAAFLASEAAPRATDRPEDRVSAALGLVLPPRLGPILEAAPETLADWVSGPDALAALPDLAEDPDLIRFVTDVAGLWLAEGRGAEAEALAAALTRIAPGDLALRLLRTRLPGGDPAAVRALAREVMAEAVLGPRDALVLSERLLDLGDLDGAVAALADQPHHMGGSERRARARSARLREVFDRVWEGRADPSVPIAAVQARLAAVTEALRVDHGPVRRDGPVRRVVVLASHDLPQCVIYRVEQKLHWFERLGIAAEVFDLPRLAEARAALPGADLLLLFRVPGFPDVLDLIAEARARGLWTLYDLDDLIFDAALFPPPLETYGGALDAARHRDIAAGVPLFDAALRACDAGLASTEALAAPMRARVRSGRVTVLPNGLDPRHLGAVAGQGPRPGAGPVTILYGSGTLAHKGALAAQLGPALAEVLARHGDGVRVRLVGPGGALAGVDPADPRVIVLPGGLPFADWLAEVGRADICLSVLEPGPVSDAKSEIKWLEPAAFGLPCVLSPTETLRAATRDGETALWAEDAAGFAGALDRLVGDAGLRARLGAAARAEAETRFGPEAMTAALARALGPGEAGQVPAVRPRLLILHVYFPPQTWGGATRVVRDQALAFGRLFGPVWQIDVIALRDEAVEPYAAAVHVSGGVRVRTLGSQPLAEGDRTAEDPAMGAAVGACLDEIRPDVALVHCVQRLTASAVLALAERAIPYVILQHDGWWVSDAQFLVEGGRPAPLYDYSVPTGRAARLAPALHGAARRLAVSAALAEVCRSAGLADVGVAENGLPPLPVAPRVPAPDGRVRLLHAGGTGGHKGLDLLRAALERAAGGGALHLTAIDPALPPEGRRRARWGETEVLLRPPVAPDAVPGLYAAADVLVAPSLWPEAYGLVTREAAAAGCWVVASDRGAIGSDVRPGIDGFVVPVEGPAPLARVLTRIAAAPDRFTRPPPPRPLRRLDDQVTELHGILQSLVKGSDEP